MRLAALTAIVSATSALAQTPSITVRGVAFDSLRNAPLGDAFITMSGGGRTRSITADDEGRFKFDSVAAGQYTFSMQHASIDSLGFPGLSTRATISAVTSDVRVAIPAFATLWRAACGGAAAPTDSGFVHGVVREASTRAPAANASIDVSWIELAMDKDKHITQRRWRNQTRTDARGSFAVCGIPVGVAFRVQALTDSSSSGAVDVAPSDVRVQRRDLFLGSTSASHGLIAGTVTGLGGTALRDARVQVDTLAEVRTGVDGRFIVRNVPAGTRQITVTSIGLTPMTVSADVFANDTATVAIELRRVTTLDPVKVNAATRQRLFNRDLDDRKKSGFGHYMDSTRMKNMGQLSTVFENLPSTRVRMTKPPRFVVTFPAGIAECTAIVWIDGIRTDFEHLNGLRPDDLALVEVYPRRFEVPMRFAVPGSSCGAIVVWTKYHLG